MDIKEQIKNIINEATILSNRSDDLSNHDALHNLYSQVRKIEDQAKKLKIAILRELYNL